ncbi:MAG: hypothetical protein WC595_02785 [Candidatus Nanoarchaeia archaeon]
MVTKSLEAILGLKNQHRGEQGFIVGTGPSLAYRDLSALKNEITIGLNLSPLTLGQSGVTPTFNIIADKDVIPQFKDVYARILRGTPTTKIIIAGACKTFPQELIDERTYFVPPHHPQGIIRFAQNPLREGFWRGKTVAYDALQFAYFLGFDRVNVIGMDMSTNHDWGKDGHSYEIHRNPNFPNLIFPKTQSHIIQKGLPGHPEYRALIVRYMQEAQRQFEQAGRHVVNDITSSLEVFVQEDLLEKIAPKQHVVAFVPAKGTSTRVTNKNIRKLGDKSLFLHVLDTLLTCHTIQEIYLDSEAQAVFDLASGRRHKELHRPESLASNRTDGNQLFLYEARQVPDADIYVQVLPTAPFLSQSTIDEAVFRLIVKKEHDSVFAARREKMYLWNADSTPRNYNPMHIPNSVDLPATIIETMSLYAIRKATLLSGKSRIGKTPHILPIPLIESIDINTEEDFAFAELVIRGLQQGELYGRL